MPNEVYVLQVKTIPVMSLTSFYLMCARLRRKDTCRHHCPLNTNLDIYCLPFNSLLKPASSPFQVLPDFEDSVPSGTERNISIFTPGK